MEQDEDRLDPELLAELGMTEDEFERMHQEARRRGEEELPDELEVKRARYEVSSNRLIVDLANGTLLAVPVDVVPDLAGLATDQLGKVEVTGAGYWLKWGEADVYLPTMELIEMALASEKWMARVAGKLMGKQSSPAKAKSSRENGKKGGRPRKTSHAGGSLGGTQAAAKEDVT